MRRLSAEVLRSQKTIEKISAEQFLIAAPRFSPDQRYSGAADPERPEPRDPSPRQTLFVLRRNLPLPLVLSGAALIEVRWRSNIV